MNKTITIDGQNIDLEHRCCASGRCEKSFWVMKSSKQSICCGECPEITFGRPRPKDYMPPIRLVGEPAVNHGMQKTKGNFQNKIIETSWIKAQNKLKYESNQPIRPARTVKKRHDQSQASELLTLQ